MEKLVYTTLAVLLFLSVVAFKSMQQYADVFKELQMEPAEAKESIFNFQDRVLNFPYSTAAARFALGRREAAVEELADYIKAYTESAEFAAHYKDVREAGRAWHSDSLL